MRAFCASGVSFTGAYRPAVSIDSRVANSGIVSAVSESAWRSKALKLVELRVRAVIAIQPSRPLELRDDRVKRAVDVIGGAEIAQPRMRLGGQSLVQRREQPRLADACFARQEHRLAVSGPRLLPALEQKLEFLRPPHQRGRNTVARLKAALGPCLAGNAPNADRLCEALELPVADIDHIEQTRDQPLRASAMTTLPGPASGLQPRCQIGRVADDGLLLRRSFTDQIAYNDEPGGDADACGQGFAARCGQAGGRRRRRQSRADRPFRIILMRSRPAEIGEHPVAHQLGDLALVADDLRRHRAG